MRSRPNVSPTMFFIRRTAILACSSMRGAKYLRNFVCRAARVSCDKWPRRVGRLTGTKKFLLLLPLVFFCAVRPAHAQTKYYIGGCIAETASSASVNCSPSPGIPIGSSVAVYVTFTARMPSMRENTRILVAFCIGALLGMAIVFSVV